MLHTDSMETGLVVSGHEIANLPANGRNFIALTLLAPGVVAPHLASFANGLRSASGGRPYVNGNRKEANNFQLDGVDNNQTTDNLVSYQPSPDAIQELRLVTNNAPAEFGNYQGGIIHVTLKSGTNSLHGTMFELFRDDALNATNWARKWMPADPLNPRKAPLRQHLFGGAIGGPIVSNRVFFFGDYQATRRLDGPVTHPISLIPAAMRQGDFSALLEGSSPQQLYDPLTTRSDQSGRVVRDPFPNNQIPLDRINPVAAQLFASRFYPEPTLPGLIDNARNSSRSTLDNDQFDVKIDATVTPRDDLSARYAHGRQRISSSNTAAIFLGSATRSPFQAAALHWARQLGAHVFNEARAGLNRVIVLADSGIDVAGIGNLGDTLGVRGANALAPGLPTIAFGGAASALGSSKVVQQFVTNTFQYQDNLMWHRGRHAVKAGVHAATVPAERVFLWKHRTIGHHRFHWPVHARSQRSPFARLARSGLLPRLPAPCGTGWLCGHVGTPQHVVGGICTGRLASLARRDAESGPSIRSPSILSSRSTTVRSISI